MFRTNLRIKSTISPGPRKFRDFSAHFSTRMLHVSRKSHNSKMARTKAPTGEKERPRARHRKQYKPVKLKGFRVRVVLFQDELEGTTYYHEEPKQESKMHTLLDSCKRVFQYNTQQKLAKLAAFLSNRASPSVPPNITEMDTKNHSQKLKIELDRNIQKLESYDVDKTGYFFVEKRTHQNPLVK